MLGWLIGRKAAAPAPPAPPAVSEIAPVLGDLTGERIWEDDLLETCEPYGEWTVRGPQAGDTIVVLHYIPNRPVIRSDERFRIVYLSLAAVRGISLTTQRCETFDHYELMRYRAAPRTWIKRFLPAELEVM